ncbi:PKD domain-containing protein [Natronoflexus pectinivorans]|uniref:Gliding motility-associated-like protein n=1 Tax=Natronoflexus pectinivorans TaxID=682526 RepID=A0A4R2GJS7_9BACT|nr:PKD domain-containing protein [Natronoflexus pectinivorans]TCO08817.1 gliding motility-associated-like protein [Natronoflexus pectinivorans]
MLIICWSFSSAQITAAFSVDINEGCSPLSVQFTNLSEPLENSTFEWDFGNGSFSTAAHPIANYTNVGQYTVTLVVIHEGETETLIMENFITVHPEPDVSFEIVGETIGCVPFEVEFINQSVNPSEVSFTWSFGDGNLSYDENPVNTYLPSGVFDVTLLAVNEHGCSNSYVIEEAVEVVQPKAAFGIDKVQSCEGELLVHLNNLSNAREGFTSFWDFGDGNQSEELSPDHLFQNSGEYSIKLVITDDIGCKDSVTRQNLVNIVKTEALFSVVSQVACIGENIRFTNNSNHANNFLWRFGDGTTSRSRNPLKSFSEPGDYEVWLIADNGTCIDSTMLVINIEEVIAHFSVPDNFVCQLPAAINYQNLSTNAERFQWKFGNGQISSQENPSVEYTTAMMSGNLLRNFSDTLIVTSPAGCQDVYVKQNSVMVHLPNVRMSPGRGGNSGALNGCAPMNLLFQDRTSYVTTQDEVVSWRWSVGDLPDQIGESIDVLIESGERTPVTLTVTTHRGCVHSATEHINAGVEVDVQFSRVGGYSRCASEMIMFEITSPPASMRTREVWDFGDGSEQFFPIPAHNYTDIGQMDVSLTVFNNGCPSTRILNNHLNILGPYAEFSVITNCENPYRYQFESEIKDATSYYWDFGDGSPFVSNVPNPVHNYSQSGNYVVRLVTENSVTGCEFIATREVYPRKIRSDFELVSGLPCRTTALTFDGSTSEDLSPFLHNNQTIRYLWKVEEEGVSIGSMSPDFVHEFKNTGENNLLLIVRDANGCIDTMRHAIRIYEPQPDFVASHETGCMPVVFGFVDQTESESPIASWLWSFGDGKSSADQNPYHEYNEFGSYSVTLEVTDEIGCINSINKNQAVQAIFPEALFEADGNLGCVGDTVRLFDVSPGNIVSYNWEIGDGRVSSEAKPDFVFIEPGYYSVNLEVIDEHGCEASLFAEHFIHIQSPPVAAFEADVLSSNCYPLVVQFHDLSETEYPGTWEWQFGVGGSRSFLQNPYYIYNRPGKFDVSLIARTTYGCADTIILYEYIDVGGPYAEISVADTVCLSTEVFFSAVEINDVYDIRWDFGDGYSANGEAVSHSYTQPGNLYPIMIIRSDAENTCNIAVRDTIHVMDVRAQFSILENTQTGCVPWQVMLSNQSHNSHWWQWNFGNDSVSVEENPIAIYPEAGSYQIKLISGHDFGCTDTLIIEDIEIYPLPVVETNPDVIICEGDVTTLFASGGVAYQWTPSERLINPDQAVTEASPSVTTWYRVDVIDENGCENFGTTEIVVQHPPVVSILDTTLIVGETIQFDLFQNEILRYEWSPATNISCADCPDPIFKALESINYHLAVTDTSECFTVTFPFNLTVQHLYSVDLPGAFIPGMEGENSKVFVKGWGIKELVSLKIFNRFGQLVFESNDMERGWDGEFKGQPLPSETYSYSVQVLTYENTVLNKTGTIKLIR